MASAISFEEILADIRAISARIELILEEIPAPQKLAPFAFAMTADTEDEIATARLVPVSYTHLTLPTIYSV